MRATSQDSLLRPVAGSTSEDNNIRRVTAAITTEAVDFLRMEFAVLSGHGCNLAAETAVGAMDEEKMRASSRMAMADVPLSKMGKIPGHKSPVTTQRYAHMSDKSLHDAVDRIRR